MKRLALIPLLATAAVAAHAQPYLDNARVTGVEPQYESVRVPRQECSNQWISEPRRGEQVVLTGFADGPQHVKWALSKVERAS